MKEIFNKGLETFQSATDKAISEVMGKWTLVSEVVNDLPVFVSFERSKPVAGVEFDEKHYFVIPYRLSDVGVALHTMRCLPDGVPEINDLPKRRVFHFANEHAEILIRKILLQQSREIVESQGADKQHTLESLANDIDALDKKLTYGMLVVGGLATLVNPALGLGIAAKAVLPGVATLFSKYGLRPAGEKLGRSQIQKEIKEAEQRVLSEFESATTLQLINPILVELELALNTDESVHDPLMDFDMSNLDINELDGDKWRKLTERAIYHVYKECLGDSAKHKEASLGPEDIRWLNIMFRDNS